MSTPADAAREGARQADGKFGTYSLAEDTDLDLGRPEPTHDELNDARWKGQPFTVTVQPQAWDNDYAVDAGPAVTFDIAPLLKTMHYDERVRLFESLRTRDHDALDQVYLDAADAGLVKAGFGPFYVEPDMRVSDEEDGDDLDAWDAANPYVPPVKRPLSETEKLMTAQHPRDENLDLSGAMAVAVTNSEGEFLVTPGTIDDEFQGAYDTGTPSLALAATIAREKDWDVVLTLAEDHYDVHDNDHDSGEPASVDVYYARAQTPGTRQSPVVSSYGPTEPESLTTDRWLGRTRYYSVVLNRPSRGDDVERALREHGVVEGDLAVAGTFRKPLLDSSGF